MAGQLGWGSLQPAEIDAGKGRLVVVVAGSPFAEAYGGTDHGVCHLIRGALSGMAEGLFGCPVESEETMCLAKGDPHCRFEVRSRD
jgi:predicted hydrocarbon binding protein